MHLVTFLESQFPLILGTYKESYNMQHALIRLSEELRRNLEKNFLVGDVFINLSKAFDCILRDLLIAKLAANGFKGTALKYIYSYRKNRRQCVRLNNTYSDFKVTISGFCQGSIVGLILFNAFLNDCFLGFFCIKQAPMHKFADENKLSSFAKTFIGLISIDNQLSFNQHVSHICKSASNQLNVLRRLKTFLRFKAKKVLINTFILSNFSYCPIVWLIS